MEQPQCDHKVVNSDGYGLTQPFNQHIVNQLTAIKLIVEMTANSKIRHAHPAQSATPFPPGHELGSMIVMLVFPIAEVFVRKISLPKKKSFEMLYRGGSPK